MARPSQTRKILNTVGAELQQELKSPGLSAERKKSVLRQLGQVGIALARLDHQEFKRREVKAEKSLPGNQAEGNCAANPISASPANSPVPGSINDLYKPKVDSKEPEGAFDLLLNPNGKLPATQPSKAPEPKPVSAPEVKTESPAKPEIKPFGDRIKSAWEPNVPVRDVHLTDISPELLPRPICPVNGRPAPMPRIATELRVPSPYSMEGLYGIQADPKPARPIYDEFKTSINSLSESGAPRPQKDFGNPPINENGLRDFIAKGGTE
jgi:hypothetical protein